MLIFDKNNIQIPFIKVDDNIDEINKFLKPHQFKAEFGPSNYNEIDNIYHKYIDIYDDKNNLIIYTSYKDRYLLLVYDNNEYHPRICVDLRHISLYYDIKEDDE